MAFPRSVLCAVDGSRESDLALEHVVDLVAGRTGTSVHLVHVGLVSVWTSPRTLGPGQLERLRADAQQVLDAQVERLRALGRDPDGTHLRLGRTTDEVLRLRDELDADLVVVGSRGVNAFTRVLLGTDAEGIVRHAPCPVLVVRKDR